MLLYKYFPEQRISFFEDWLVRFTPVNDFNDLLEGRGQFEWFVPPEEAVEGSQASFDNLIAIALAAVFANQPGHFISGLSDEQTKNLLCSTEEANLLREDLRNYMRQTVHEITPVAKESLYRKFCNWLGIFCLSETAVSHTMWGYYTNHRGFVIAFDSGHQFFHNDRDADGFLGKLHKVSYVADLPRHQSIDSMQIEDIFLIKQDEWRHEAEWRILDALQYADTVVQGELPIHLFKVPVESVREVIFGFRMDAKLKQQVLSQIQSQPQMRHIAAKQVKLDSETAQLKIIPATN